MVATVPPRASGSIETYAWKDGRTVTFRARVRAYGQRHRLDFGTNHEGWSLERAENELARITRQIERGTWEAPEPEARRVVADTSVPAADETFHVFVSRWWADKAPTLRPRARADYRWRLDHLLGFFHAFEVRAIGVREVDRYRAAKLREREALTEAHAAAKKTKRRAPRRRPLSNRSINMTIDLLAQVLDQAVEYELLDVNPARGKRRRLPAVKSRRTFLEPDMVVDLLDAAGAWERELPVHQHYGRRALLATLCLAGPRISELTGATRARLDIAGGRLRVGEAKTEAGLRDIELTMFLAGELRSHLAAMAGLRRLARASTPIFATRPGGHHNASNIRNRLLAESVRRANEKRAARSEMLLPDTVTPHTLRRTFASLALAAGRDPRWVMGQIGHTDARLTLSVYAQVIQRQRVDDALIWELMRFPDEAEERPSGRRSPTSDPTNGPTGAAVPSDRHGTLER